MTLYQGSSTGSPLDKGSSYLKIPHIWEEICTPFKIRARAQVENLTLEINLHPKAARPPMGHSQVFPDLI